MPKGELQNYIGWCFKRFANFTDDIDYNQESSYLNHATYIAYSTVAILLTSFQCDKQAVHMVCYTRFTRWRPNKLQRNHTVLLGMGPSPDSHFKSTAECIPTHLKCHFMVEDTESSVKGLRPLFWTFPTGPMYQTAGMLIVEKRNQPQTQPFNDRSYRRKPLFRIRTTYIIPMRAILEAVHLYPLTLEPDSMQWYLCNMIGLNCFNLIYK